MSTQHWEMRWDAQEQDNTAHARWLEMAEKKIRKTLSLENPDFDERFEFEKEKLKEQDVAIITLWKNVESLYKKTTQEELLKKIGPLRNSFEQRSDEDRTGYSYTLDQIRERSMKRCFQKADQAFKNQDQQLFDLEEKKARAAYEKEARLKALEDAEKKTPGATKAWDQLPIKERRHHNGNVLEANKTEETRAIGKIESSLYDLHKAIDEAESVFNAWAYVIIDNKTHLVNGDLKLKSFERVLEKWSDFQNYLNELKAEDEARAAYYQKKKLLEAPFFLTQSSNNAASAHQTRSHQNLKNSKQLSTLPA